MVRFRYLSYASQIGEPSGFGVWLDGTGIGGNGEYLGDIRQATFSANSRGWYGDGNLVKRFPAAAHAPSLAAMKLRLRRALMREVVAAGAAGAPR